MTADSQRTYADPLLDAVQRIIESPDFPAFAKQLNEIMTGLLDVESSIQHLANIVLRDYSLSLKALRTANSIHYNRSGRPVQSATHAMLILGANVVRELAGTMLVFDHYARKSDDLKQLLLLSMLTAHHAREAAVAAGMSEIEDAYLSGMCYNLGEVLVACHFPAAYAKINALRVAEGMSATAASIRVLSFTYRDLAAAITRLWGMPDVVQECIRETPAAQETKLYELTCLGHALTEAVYCSDPADTAGRLAALEERFGAKLGLSAEAIAKIVESAAADTRALFEDANISLKSLRLAHQAGSAIYEFADAESAADAAETDPARLIEQRRKHLLSETLRAGREGKHELHELVMIALETILQGLPADHVAFCLLDGQREELRGRFGLGPNIDGLMRRIHLPAHANGLLPDCVRSGRDIAIGTAGNPPRPEEVRWLRKIGASGLAFLTLRVEGIPIGAIYLDRVDEPLELDEVAVTFLRMVRDAVVLAIELSRKNAQTAA